MHSNPHSNALCTILTRSSTILDNCAVHVNVIMYELQIPIRQIRCQGFLLSIALTVEQTWYSCTLHAQSTSIYWTVCTVCTRYCVHACGRMSVRQLLAKQRVRRLKLLKLLKSDQISIFVERCDEMSSDWCDCFLSASVTENTTTTSPRPRPQMSNEIRWRLSLLNPNPPKRKYSTKITKTMGHLDEIEKIWLAASCRIFVELLLDTSALLMKRLNMAQ